MERQEPEVRNILCIPNHEAEVRKILCIPNHEFSVIIHYLAILFNKLKFDIYILHGQDLLVSKQHEPEETDFASKEFVKEQHEPKVRKFICIQNYEFSFITKCTVPCNSV